MWTSTGALVPAPAGPERRRVMSAQTPYVEVDAIGVFPTLLLVMVLVLTALGVLAHVAFARPVPGPPPLPPRTRGPVDQRRGLAAFAGFVTGRPGAGAAGASDRVEVDGVAGCEQPDDDVRGQGPRRVDERRSGRLERLRHPAAEAGGIERPPMDRDRDPRAQPGDGLGRSLGIHVSGADRGAPSPHRRQRDVDQR